MANKFVTILDEVGAKIKVAFTSPTGEALETGALDIAEIAFPGLSSLWAGLTAAIAKAQALVSAANIPGDSTAAVTALTMQGAQSAFNAYQQASGKTVETPQQEQIVALALQMLATVPGTPVVGAAPVPAAPAAPVPAAPAIQLVPA